MLMCLARWTLAIAAFLFGFDDAFSANLDCPKRTLQCQSLSVPARPSLLTGGSSLAWPTRP